jgi:hypothetical protein
MMILTCASIAVALVMSVIAWRATSEARRRSEARIAALAEDIHSPSIADAVPLRPDVTAIEPIEPIEPVARHHGGESAAAMFATASEPAEPSRWGLALAAGAFVVATVAAAAIVFSGESPSAATAATADNRATHAAASNRSAGPVPLELTALGHEREGEQLTVRGVVRNPAQGAAMEHLTAVVSLFNRNGDFLTSGRAPVASPSLIPGGESTFVVTIPAAGDVGRYRVSFRSDERAIAHIDKRSIS